MNIAVVGAGFTGCLAALYAARRGAQVTVFESASRLGGILRDVEVRGQRYYNGCHYLRRGSTEFLNLKPHLKDFPHEYGALTKLGNRQARLVDDCAQPALDGKAQISPDAALDGTALQRLSAYGPDSQKLIAWAGSFGNLAELDQRCLLPMQLSRVFYPEDEDLQVKKASDASADQLIAVPRRIRKPGTQAESASVPSDGFNPLLDEMERALKDAGVRLRMDAPVKLLDGGAGVGLYHRGQQERFDHAVWAANPTAVLKKVCGISLKTPPIAMKLWVGQFTTAAVAACPVPLPYYWQIFDEDSPVVRVYVYELQGHLRFSVEAFDRPGVDELQTLGQVFQSLGLPTGFDLAASVAQQRHVNFSTAEMSAMQACAPALMGRGIIPGGWCHYGRDEKIASMARCLEHVLS